MNRRQFARLAALAVAGSGTGAMIPTVHAEHAPTFSGQPWQDILRYSALAYGSSAATPFPTDTFITQALYQRTDPDYDVFEVDGEIGIMAFDAWAFSLHGDAGIAWPAVLDDLLRAYEMWARDTQPFTMRLGPPGDAAAYSDIGDESHAYAGWQGNELDAYGNAAAMAARSGSTALMLICWAIAPHVDDANDEWQDEAHQYLHALARAAFDGWNESRPLSDLLPVPESRRDRIVVSTPVDLTEEYRPGASTATPPVIAPAPPISTYFGDGKPRGEAVPEYMRNAFGPRTDPETLRLLGGFPDAPVVTSVRFRSYIEPPDGAFDLSVPTLLELDAWVFDLVPDAFTSIDSLVQDICRGYNDWYRSTLGSIYDESMGISGSHSTDLGDEAREIWGEGGRSVWAGGLAVRQGTRVLVMNGWSAYATVEDTVMAIIAAGIGRWDDTSAAADAFPLPGEMQPSFVMTADLDTSAPFLDPGRGSIVP